MSLSTWMTLLGSPGVGSTTGISPFSTAMLGGDHAVVDRTCTSVGLGLVAPQLVGLVVAGHRDRRRAVRRERRLDRRRSRRGRRAPGRCRSRGGSRRSCRGRAAAESSSALSGLRRTRLNVPGQVEVGLHRQAEHLVGEVGGQRDARRAGPRSGARSVRGHRRPPRARPIAGGITSERPAPRSSGSTIPLASAISRQRAGIAEVGRRPGR